MKVKDVMTKNVAYVNPNTTVVEAAQLMQKHNVGSIPVCDANGVIGIVTDRDIVVRNVAHGTNPQSTPVQNVMTSGVTTVTPDMDINDVSKIMSQSQIRRIPVVENNKLIGIVALGDLATDAKFDTEVSAALTEISKPSNPVQMPKK
ncbi:MAG: CBS domain-containing protein [Clostridia bacterium]|nr:CBS domain-containing protein [Clostridia bacterium]